MKNTINLSILDFKWDEVQNEFNSRDSINLSILDFKFRLYNC